MTTEHVKVFSGSSIIINRLKNLLDDNNIHYIIKKKVESARLAGFGADINSVELFVLSTDVEKTQPIIDGYKKEINS